jgi:hypothetical protein
MTLDQAIDQARTIQADLAAGRLRVPYPPEVRRTIVACAQVFMAEATDTAKARALVARLNAPELETTELPWWSLRLVG